MIFYYSLLKKFSVMLLPLVHIILKQMGNNNSWEKADYWIQLRNWTLSCTSKKSQLLNQLLKTHETTTDAKFEGEADWRFNWVLVALEDPIIRGDLLVLLGHFSCILR